MKNKFVMKKILLATVVAIFSVGSVYAQKVESKSRSIMVLEEKKESKPTVSNWFIKAGGGVLMGDDSSVHANYNVALGYQHQFMDNGLYWGAQVGSSLVEYDGSYTSLWGRSSSRFLSTCASIYLGPTLGIKRPIGQNTQFDGHIGISYQHAFASDDDGDDGNRALWEVGLGFWYKRFLIELEYQGSTPYILNNGILLNIVLRF